MCSQRISGCDRHFFQIAQLNRCSQYSHWLHSQRIFDLLCHIHQTFLRSIIINTASFCLLRQFTGCLSGIFINLMIICQQMICSVITIQLDIIHINTCISLQKQPSDLPWSWIIGIQLCAIRFIWFIRLQFLLNRIVICNILKWIPHHIKIMIQIHRQLVHHSRRLLPCLFCHNWKCRHILRNTGSQQNNQCYP